MRWWRAPATVPDHAAPFAANWDPKFAGGGGFAQRITPTRDGLTSVDFVITAENPNLPGFIQVRIEAWPSRTVVRTSQIPAAAVPSESIWRLLPG